MRLIIADMRSLVKYTNNLILIHIFIMKYILKFFNYITFVLCYNLYQFNIMPKIVAFSFQIFF